MTLTEHLQHKRDSKTLLSLDLLPTCPVCVAPLGRSLLRKFAGFHQLDQEKKATEERKEGFPLQVLGGRMEEGRKDGRREEGKSQGRERRICSMCKNPRGDQPSWRIKGRGEELRARRGQNHKVLGSRQKRSMLAGRGKSPAVPESGTDRRNLQGTSCPCEKDTKTKTFTPGPRILRWWQTMKGFISSQVEVASGGLEPVGCVQELHRNFSP